MTSHQVNNEHCNDCCCARSWKALGITEYTGLSIPEHIQQLRGLIALACRHVDTGALRISHRKDFAALAAYFEGETAARAVTTEEAMLSEIVRLRTALFDVIRIPADAGIIAVEALKLGIELPVRLQRVYRGPGYLEEHGYIPCGSAAEREKL